VTGAFPGKDDLLPPPTSRYTSTNFLAITARSNLSLIISLPDDGCRSIASASRRAAVSPAASPGSTRSPVRPCAINSGHAPTRLQTTGVSVARASSTVTGVPSERLGSTRRSAAFSHSQISACGRVPTKWQLSACQRTSPSPAK
jgi:hypothetical protein